MSTSLGTKRKRLEDEEQEEKDIIMPSMTNGTDGPTETTMAHEIRYSRLPEIFEDAKQVESDWYTLAVISIPVPA